MRRVAALLALACAVRAQEPDLFAAPGPRSLPPDALVRITEEIARGAEKRDDPFTLEALAEALCSLGRAQPLADAAKKAAERATDAQSRLAAQRTVARAFLHQARTTGNFRIIFRNGNMEIVQDSAAEAYLDASTWLRLVVAADGKDTWALRALAETIDEIGAENDRAFAKELREQAAALEEAIAPAGPSTAQAASDLRTRALALEQADEPSHDEALALRKRALVLDFTDGTIAFEPDDAIYEPVSELAPAQMVGVNLTRSYRADGDRIEFVPPVHYPAGPERRAEVYRALAERGDAAAAAVLLAEIAHGEAVEDALVEAVASSPPPALLEALPAALLRTALRGGDGLPVLIRLAERLRPPGAGDALARTLALDRDPRAPLGIARTLAAAGGPEHADALLRIARDTRLLACFRRDAVDALAILAPERLSEIPEDAAVAPALAAARRDTATLVELLAGEHTADDAARYLADLGATDAIPAIEAWLARPAEHYARAAVADALARLQASE